ncbi:MAG TPA: AgmX/PglI C-terminal domain-containing protein [Polyangiaceae bacterium]|nr:AgmX/PglI C-terminal domain-containing protein [Polyangiaceae bacterium]
MGTSLLKTWLGGLGCSLLLGGCSAEVAQPARAPAPAALRWEGSGLRVSLSSMAKSVCVSDQGCSSGPKGAVSIRPLEPKLREAISDALLSAGFQLVTVDAERDMLADVEWHGTDTIALRLQDAHGRLIDEASYQRSLARCRELPDLTWDSCWAANFDAMKAELLRPLRHSEKLRSFAMKARGVTDTTVDAPTGSLRSADSVSTTGSWTRLPERLDDAAITSQLAGHQDELERACFQPAFEARSDRASSSAKVSTKITIQPSGQVDAVTTSGDPPGYLHLASCVAAHIQSWRFPAAKKATTATVPFIFAAESPR